MKKKTNKYYKTFKDEITQNQEMRLDQQAFKKTNCKRKTDTFREENHIESNNNKKLQPM